jgi:leader peptidase (prepilin peptidase)/N-methyltransferase
VTELPRWFLAVLAGVLGLVLGSFLNVCIVRWGAEPKQSVVRPRSRCPRCGASLKPWDNIPVLSWIVLGGKCRSCGMPISVMYPLVELGTGIIWAGMAGYFGFTLHALSGALLFTILLGIALTDFRNYIIPDEFTLGGLGIGLLLALAAGLHPLLMALLGAAVGFGTLWVVGWLGTVVAKKEAMGGGDIKMMAMVGAFCGWSGVLLTIFLGAVIAVFVFIPILLFRRDKLVPFGIFLALGAAVTWLAGTDIIGWYRGMVGI